MPITRNSPRTRGAALRERLDWDRPLRYRKGARERLCGIDVFYDFRWLDQFPDRRAQFRGGKDLASLVIRECPDGKRPALLLTDRDEAQGLQESDRDYVLVVDLERYVQRAFASSAAASYLASLLGGGITRAKRFSELEAHVDEAFLVRWAGEDEDRLSTLRRVGGSDAGDELRDPQRTLDALDALGSIGPEVAEWIAAIAARDDGEGRLELLWSLMEDEHGRDAAGRVLGARVGERLDDARRAADDFDEMLPTAGETEIQRFLEDNPWLLGLDYVQVRPRQTLARGAVDFLLERFDGFHDLLELKSPNDALFEGGGSDDTVRSASAFRLSRPLSLALAQVHVYRDVLDLEQAHERTYGLRHTRDPRITILIGRASELNDQEARVLHELNCSLHRVEVIPFDALAGRARAVLDTVDRYLLAAEPAPDQET